MACCAHRRPLGRSESPCVFQKGPRHQLSGGNNAQPCAPPPVSSLAGGPRSHKRVIQNFFFRSPPHPPPPSPPRDSPLPSHLRILPSYCTKRMREGGQRAAALFCSRLGLARLEVSEENCFFFFSFFPHPPGGRVALTWVRHWALRHSASEMRCFFFFVFALCPSPPKRV